MELNGKSRLEMKTRTHHWE